MLWRPRSMVVSRSSIIVVWSSGQASGSPIRLWRLLRAICTGTGNRPQGLPRVRVRWPPPRVAICTGSVTAPKRCHLYGFGDRPQGSLSGITASCIVREREEITVALVASWGALCLHTALTEISIRKGVNFGIHHRLPVPRLSLTRTLYLCTLLCDSHIVSCYISFYHLVVYLV